MEFYWFVVVGCSSYVVGLWFAADEKGFSEKKKFNCVYEALVSAAF